MKVPFHKVIYLLLVILSCSSSPNKADTRIVNTDSSSELAVSQVIEENAIEQCAALDFTQLNDSQLFTSFFQQLDSVIAYQYPQGKSEYGDINAAFMIEFLSDLNPDSLEKNNTFKKSYHFNRALEGYTDPEVCMDDIRIDFLPEECQFKMTIYETFLVSPDWCTEHASIYYFKITRNRISEFVRNEAG